MKPPSKVAVIGAGGIACALLPILSRITDVVIMDADNYEPANMSRQFPALSSVGNKAEVLASMLQPNTLRAVEAIPEYLEGPAVLNNPLFKGVEMIIGAVDNNESRELIMDLAEIMGVPAFLGGNEHEHGEAHAFYEGIYSPRQHHDFSGGEPAPFHCNSDKTIDQFPQTPVANALAAGAILHLWSSYCRVEDLWHAVVYSRTDPLCSRFTRALDFR